LFLLQSLPGAEKTLRVFLRMQQEVRMAGVMSRGFHAMNIAFPALPSKFPAINRGGFNMTGPSGLIKSKKMLSALALLAATIACFDPWEAAPAPLQIREVTPRGPLSADEQNNIAVFRNISPSVVHITTLGLATDLFTLDVTQVPRGTGTGIIWDGQGHIVTNYHVIRDASAARVTLADRSTWKAELVGASPDRDLAVLRIKAPKEKLKPILLGESSNLQVGQKVYAIGNPFGLDQTLTAGIVSALNREIQSATLRPIHRVIQTDAAINPGNSGGPLLDSAGRLIGVNTAIYSPSGAYAGIGFAIPVDAVRRIVPRLIRDGNLIRPAIGIHGASDDVRQALGLPPGVVIVGVERDSPASRAGIRPFYRDEDGSIVMGDELTAINGSPVASDDELLSALEDLQAGDKISVTILRNGQKLDKSIVLERPG
jgi:S1-C subfamily serine protease